MKGPVLVLLTFCDIAADARLKKKDKNGPFYYYSARTEVLIPQLPVAPSLRHKVESYSTIIMLLIH